MGTNDSDRELRIVESALAQASLARADFIARECGADEALAGRVRDLLARIENGDASREVIDRVLPGLAPLRDGVPMPAQVDVGALHRLGKYRIDRELGRGGQGIVFLAVDETLDRKVALKVLHPSAALDSGTRQRFQREAGIASRLEHPGICVVYETGAENGVDYIAMRFVEGHTLTSRVLDQATPDLIGFVPGEHGGDPMRAVAELIEKTARALHAAHEAGIVHRDIKSGNILVTLEGEPVILDFGLAREQTPGTTITLSADLLGTPIFMSPEQVSGPVKALDRRTDVWSLGVVLYHCLALDLPFEGPTIHDILRRIKEEEPIRLRRRNRLVPLDLEVITHTALEKDVTRRYRTAFDLAEDLRRFREHETILARPASPAQRVLRYSRRHPIRALAFALAVFVVGLAASTLFLQSSLAETNDELRARNDVLSARAMKEFEAKDLWPIEPRIVKLCDDWLARLTDLNSRRGVAAELLRRARGEQRLAEPMDSFLLSIFDGHFELLDELDTLVPVVRERRDRAATLEQRSIHDAKAAWNDVIERIAQSPRYDGLLIDPIVGLSPLGLNEQGYAEFWLVESGERPESRAPSGWVMTPKSGIVLVLLPGGDFRVGSTTDSADPRYDPYHQTSEPMGSARLDPFFVSKYEFTQGQWRNIMGENPSGMRAPRSSGKSAIDESHPVESVKFERVLEACSRLGLTLPTDMQWEYVCRAGTDTIWNVGNDEVTIGNAANFLGEESRTAFSLTSEKAIPFQDGFVRHAPVGSFPANGFGVHDMHGNVGEWCRDRYLSAIGSIAPRDGDGLREPPDETHQRPTRGGHFADTPRIGRSGGRFGTSVVALGYQQGFRPIRTLKDWRRITR